MTSEHPSALLNATMKGVPAFLRSLYHMVDDENTNLIHWSDDGESFFIKEHDRFAKDVLGVWFKHTNYSSFVRQLNNYGFHKLLHLQQGALRSNGAQEYHHYEHPEFRRGGQDLLGRIQRKGQSAPDEPIKSPEVHKRTSVKNEDVLMLDITPTEDFSQNRLIKAILLEVEGLKRRQDEQERENQNLRDKLDFVEANMARHQDVILRLLASLGLLSRTDQNWASREHCGPLMIQGVKEHEKPKAAGIATADANREIPPALSDPRPTISEIHDGGDYISHASLPNSPIGTDRPPSPPLSPSSSAVDSDQFEFISLEDVDLTNCGGSEIPGFSADLSDYSLGSLQSDHLYCDTFSYSLASSEFIASSGETAVNLDQTYGVDEFYPGIFQDSPSSHTLGSGTGSSTLASDTILRPGATSTMHITTDATTSSSAISPATPPAKGDSNFTTASAKGTKRKKHLVDESRTECASHPPVPSLSLHDTQSLSNAFQHTTTLPVKEELAKETIRSTLPRVNFTFDPSTRPSPSGVESASRSPKRARTISADHL